MGCSRTVLIATVSPTDDSVQYSLNTLQYANRVRQMTIRSKKKYEKSLKLRGLANMTKQNFIKNELNLNQNGLNNNNIKASGENGLHIVSASSRKLLLNSENKSNCIKVSLDRNPITLNSNCNKRTKTVPAVLLEFENPKFKTSVLNDENIKPTVLVESRINLQNSSDHNNNNVPSLFHPSKINMASTPIKSNRFESMFFVLLSERLKF